MHCNVGGQKLTDGMQSNTEMDIVLNWVTWPKAGKDNEDKKIVVADRT